MVPYEIALPILQIEPLSVFLQSTEEFEQGGLLGGCEAVNPACQFVRRRSGHEGGVTCAVQTGGCFLVSGQKPLQINVEGVGVEPRSNRRKCSFAIFVGGIIRPAKGSRNLVGAVIFVSTSYWYLFLKDTPEEPAEESAKVGEHA